MLINSLTQPSLDALITELLAIDRLSQQVYLLLDGALNPRLLKQVQRGSMDWLSVFTLSRKGEDRLLSVSPLLLAWQPQHQTELRQLLAHCNGLPMASIWVSSEALPALAQRLAAWCVVKADEQYFNLRFPDTRRLPDIARVLTPQQHATLFGAVSVCWYLGRDGGWHQLDIHNTPSAPPADEPELDLSQTLKLIQAAEADELLQLIRSRSVLPDKPPLQLYQCMISALQAADLAALEDPQARLQRCQQALEAL